MMNVPYSLLLRCWQRSPVHALRNSLRKKLLGLACYHMQHYRRCTRTLSIDSNFAGVTSKCGYVLVYPSEGLDLVLEPCVEISICRIREFGNRQEADGV